MAETGKVINSRGKRRGIRSRGILRPRTRLGESGNAWPMQHGDTGLTPIGYIWHSILMAACWGARLMGSPQWSRINPFGAHPQRRTHADVEAVHSGVCAFALDIAINHACDRWLIRTGFLVRPMPVRSEFVMAAPGKIDSDPCRPWGVVDRDDR
jgi:hypothetical protein